MKASAYSFLSFYKHNFDAIVLQKQPTPTPLTARKVLLDCSLIVFISSSNSHPSHWTDLASKSANSSSWAISIRAEASSNRTNAPFPEEVSADP